MITIPDALWRKFDRSLDAAGVAGGEHRAFRKWLRYYLDFCSKYKHGYADAASIPPFLEKLKSKRQRPAAREQAEKSVAIYQAMVRDADKERRLSRSKPVRGGETVNTEHGGGGRESVDIQRPTSTWRQGGRVLE